MTAIVRNEFRVFNVKTFKEKFGTTQNLYVGIGKPYFWDLTQNTDVAPDLPLNTPIGTERDWEDLMHLKQVNPVDISFGVFKETWTPNTKYDAYRHDWDGTRSSVYNGVNPYSVQPADLSKAKYYVVTQNYNIYICLKQSKINGIVQPSTQNPETGVPVGVNTGIVKTLDGYYWKFIANTSQSNIVKFSTDTYHPVSTVTSGVGPYADQWTSQQNSANLKRGVYVINVLNGGTWGFNGGNSGTIAFPSANIVVKGNGNGIAGTVTFGPSGYVQSIEVTNPGTGYTHLTMTIEGNNHDFTYEPIYSPAWGLGADPVYDLNAYNVIVNTVFNASEGGIFTTTNEYRKICLLANPFDYSTTNICTAQLRDATTTLTVAGTTGPSTFLPDQIITGTVSGAKARVVDWNSTTNKVRIIRTVNENYDQAGAGNSFTVGDGVASGVSVTTVTPPTVQPYSGQLIYTEYRQPITRTTGQSENVIIVLEF